MSSPEANTTPNPYSNEVQPATALAAPAAVETQPLQPLSPEQTQEEVISFDEAKAMISDYLRQRGVEKVMVVSPPQTEDFKSILKKMVMKQKARNFIDPVKKPELYKKLTEEIEEAKLIARSLVEHVATLRWPPGAPEGLPGNPPPKAGDLRFPPEYIEEMKHYIENPEDALMDSPRRSFWKNLQREQIDTTATAELESNTPDVKMADFIGGNNQGSFFFDGRQIADGKESKQDIDPFNGQSRVGVDPLTGKARLRDNILVHYINGYPARDSNEAMNMENALRPDMRCDFLFLRNSEHRGKGITCLFRKRAALEEGNEALVLSNGKAEKIYGRHARLAGKGDMAVMDRVAQQTFLKLDTRRREYFMEVLKVRMSPQDQEDAKLFLAQQDAYNNFKKNNPNREPNRTELLGIAAEAKEGAKTIDLFHDDDPENFVLTSEMLKSVEMDRSTENRTGFGQLLLTEIQNAESPDADLSGEYRRIRGCNELGYQLSNRIIMGGDSARAAADTGRDGYWAFREDVEAIPLVKHLRNIEAGILKDQEKLRQMTKQAAEDVGKERAKTPAERAAEAAREQRELEATTPIE